jgi:hypothetical protein
MKLKLQQKEGEERLIDALLSRDPRLVIAGRYLRVPHSSSPLRPSIEGVVTQHLFLPPTAECDWGQTQFLCGGQDWAGFMREEENEVVVGRGDETRDGLFPGMSYLMEAPL